MESDSESIICAAIASCDSASRIAEVVSVFGQQYLHSADLKMEECQKLQENVAQTNETEVSKPTGREK